MTSEFRAWFKRVMEANQGPEVYDLNGLEDDIWEKIEPLIEALEFYAEDSQFSDGTKMNSEQKRDMDDYGATAKSALAKFGGGE